MKGVMKEKQKEKEWLGWVCWDQYQYFYDEWL